MLAERQAARSRTSATAQAVWAELYEEVGKAFGATRDRRYATSRAAMFAKALLAACDAEQRAYEQEPDAAELHEQQLNRTLERVATLSEVPPTMVAIEYVRGPAHHGGDRVHAREVAQEAIGAGLQPLATARSLRGPRKARGFSNGT